MMASSNFCYMKVQQLQGFDWNISSIYFWSFIYWKLKDPYIENSYLKSLYIGNDGLYPYTSFLVNFTVWKQQLCLEPSVYGVNLVRDCTY
jgi:hypothetical protein